MFRFYNGLSPRLMNNIFKLKAENYYNLTQVSQFSRLMVKRVYNGTESILYLGPNLWDILSKKLKNIDNLEHFKRRLKHGNLIIAHVGSVKFTLKA